MQSVNLPVLDCLTLLGRVFKIVKVTQHRWRYAGDSFADSAMTTVRSAVRTGGVENNELKPNGYGGEPVEVRHTAVRI